MIWFVNTVTQSKIKWFEWYAYFLGKNENTFSIKNGSCYKIVYFSSESLDLRKPNLRNNQVLRKWISVGMSYLESTLKKNDEMSCDMQKKSVCGFWRRWCLTS